ncbi:MAG: hypothetical protein V1863_01255 [Candidatus Omnitrophota bacterium]
MSLHAAAAFCPARPFWRTKRFQRGQQTMEYAIFIFAISVALLTMYMYSRRGLQSVVRYSSDQLIGPQEDFYPASGSTVVNTISTVNTLTDTSMHIRKINGERRYETAAVSATEGNTISISETY